MESMERTSSSCSVLVLRWEAQCLAYLQGILRWCFCWFLSLSFSSFCLTSSSKPSRSSWRMLRSMAIWLTLARKLAWQMFWWRFGWESSKWKQASCTLRLRSYSKLLIFSMSMMRSICPVVSSLRRSSPLALTAFWSIPHLRQQWGRYWRCSCSLREDLRHWKPDVLRQILQAGTYLPLSSFLIQLPIIMKRTTANGRHTSLLQNAIEESTHFLLHRLPPLLALPQNFPYSLLQSLADLVDSVEVGDFGVFVQSELLLGELQRDLGAGSVFVEVSFHFWQFFEVEVHVDDELVESGVFESAEVLLDVGEVRVENLDGTCDFAVPDFGVAPEHFLLALNLLLLLQLLDHFGAGLFADVGDFLLLLDALGLAVLVPLWVFGVEAGLVLEPCVEVEVVAAGELGEGVEVELADRLAPVEEHFLKNRHQAVLDAGQSENLHADVVHHLRLPKMPLLLAQPHRRVRLFPKNSLPHHHFHQLFERGPFSRLRSEAFAEQLHSSQGEWEIPGIGALHAVGELVEPLLHELLLVFATMEVQIVDESIAAAEQFVEDAAKTPYVRPVVDAVHMLGSKVGPVVELQTISWLPVGQAEVDDAVAVGHLMIVLKFFGDSDVGGTQASQKKGGRAVVVVGYEFEHLLGEVAYEVSLYGLAILQLFQLFELSHSRFYLVVQGVLQAAHHQIKLLLELQTSKLAILHCLNRIQKIVLSGFGGFGELFWFS